MAFAEADLNVSQDELTSLTAGLANSGVADPFPNAMAENERKVRDWTARYVVPEETLKRLWRPLVLFSIYSLVGDISKARQTAYEEAMKELTAIRDGEFANFPLSDPQPSGFESTGGKWGSSQRIC